MSTTAETAVATQVYRTYIKASPQAIWDAITQPEWTDRYGYRGRVEYELRPGGAYRAHPSDAMSAHGVPDVIIDGDVLEAEEPRRLVQTWRALFDEPMAAEVPSRLTWELDADERGFTRLVLTHELDGAPRTASMVSGVHPETGGGWSWVLSDLKTLLETGSSLES